MSKIEYVVKVRGSVLFAGTEHGCWRYILRNKIIGAHVVKN